MSTSIFQWNVLKVIYLYLTTPIMFTMLICFIALAVLSATYNPTLNVVLKAPLLNLLGMTYGNIFMSVWRLKLRITDITLQPSKSDLIKLLILVIIPSANVMPSKNSIDFPESKITIGKLTIKIRMNSIAKRSASNFDADEDEFYNNKTGGGEDEKTTLQKEITFGWFAFLHRYIPRPVIAIVVHNVKVHIEKVYIAPKPPALIQQRLKDSPRDDLPMALPFYDDGALEDLPTFDQTYFWEQIRDEGIKGADDLTVQVQRWIEYAVTKLKTGGGDSSTTNGRDATSSPTSQPKDESTHSNIQTHDEKVNGWITFFFQILAHMLTLDIVNASLIISGVGSDYVSKVRKKYSPREANLRLAKLPKKKRALVVIGVDLVSASFSPDSQCNLLGCFVGGYLKVGYPLDLALSGSKEDTELQYMWHNVVDPFQFMLEFKGLIPFLVFLMSYDHNWVYRTFELNLSMPKWNLNLSPENIHTIFLHVDDYTDISSPLTQWMAWLRCARLEILELTPEQKMAYCKNYAKINGKKEVEAESDGQHLLTSTQMKEMELAMDQWEIVSLRCFAMRKYWLVPKENGEFADFLRSTRSSISFRGDVVDVDVDSYHEDLSPFQQVYPTPLHALFMMVWGKMSILAPPLTFTLTAGTYLVDFPSDIGKIKSRGGTQKKVIPSSLASSGVEFRFDRSHPIFHRSQSLMNDTQRSFVDLSLQVAGMRWDLLVGKNDEILLELPLFRSNVPAGIVYERHGVPKVEKVLSIEFGYSIFPTTGREPHLDLTIQSSNLVVMMNPLPILSSIDTLVKLLRFPFQPQTVDGGGESDVGGSFLNINTHVNVSVKNVSVIFVVDRTKLNRGLLDFNMNKIDMEFRTGGSSAQLTVSTGPFSLDAARVSYRQSHPLNRLEKETYFEQNFEGIIYWLMPFKPIILIEGAEIVATGKEDTRKLDKTTNEATILGMNVKINADTFALNASPTTIVAVRGVIGSFEPFLLWMKEDADEEARIKQLKLEEQERNAVEIQRQVLTRVFKEIDSDGSGFLSADELEQVVVTLSNELRAGFTLTDEERMRETNYLVSMVDRSKTNEVSYQELEEAVQMMSGNIDDNHLVPKGGAADFAHSDQFLSSFQLRHLLYYEDLKEYASTHIVNEITGGVGNGTTSSFPSPSLWHHGRGIDIFWELYTKGTGCSRTSLNGQNMESVQRRLVRSFCNYEFAKFCWMSLVGPAIISDGDSKATSTRWLLDVNHKCKFRSGVTDLLKERISRETKESIQDSVAALSDNCRYDLSIAVVVNCVSAGFGSSHKFARPLLEANLTNMSLNMTTLISGDGRFVETRSSDKYAESNGTNIIQFQGVMSAMYQNTKHSHMECFIEPYPCFGQATYQILQGDQLFDPTKAIPSEPSWSVKVDCPRFFTINTSPSFFETYAVIAKVIGRTPESHREFLYQRDLVFIQDTWDSFQDLKTGCLDRDGATDVLCAVVDKHWTHEFEGMSSEAKRENLRNFVQGMKFDDDGLVSFDAVAVWFGNLTSRNYFTGVDEIQMHNDLGMELKIAKKSTFDSLRARVTNEANFQIMLNSFQSIVHGVTDAVCLRDFNERIDYSKQSLCGNLSLYLPGFRLIENVAVNPYQTLMFKLKMRKGINGKSNRRRKTQGVSGFKPYLTVVPKSTSLDTISLYVRSNIVIRSEIPVKIRIVRLGKSAGQFSKQGMQKRNKKSVDLTKKYLMTALNRAVEGAPIVYERICKGEADVVALPVAVLVSSSFHAILIQDVAGKANNAWRSPLLFTRDFLFNPMNIRDVFRYHTMSGVVIQKERHDVQLTGRHRYKSSPGDTKSNMMRQTAWDVTIRVVPSFLCMNSLPFPISVRLRQNAIKDKDDDWDGAAAALVDPESSSSSDDDGTAMTPGISGKVGGDQYHLSTSYAGDYYHEDVIDVGETIRLSGINLSHPLFIEVSQHVQTDVADSILRASPIQLDLQKLKTGMNRKGSRSLKEIILDLGDSCDCLVDVSLDRATKMPLCSIYSPFWLINKSGMKLEYSVDGPNVGVKRYLDSGAGGLPVLMHCGKSDETNAKFDHGSNHLSVIPLECPREDIVNNWWDKSTNGKFVLKKNAIVDSNSHLVDWCTRINMDQAGTDGEINCDWYVLQAQIESLAGAFHRSNLIKIAPRFIVKNSLHISITILPLVGGPRDVRKMATYLRESLNESEEKLLINLLPGESTILYNFNKCHHTVNSHYRWVAFRVNARRFGAAFKCKWHMVPLDVIESHLFGEHDGVNDTLCGIIEAKVHSSQGGSILTSISHADTPPFRIENRSQTHYLQVSQDDDEADIIELPPMHSCGYTWDSPLGKKRLRVAVVPGRRSASEMNLTGKTLDSDANSTASTIDSDDDSEEGETIEEPLLRSLREGISSGGQSGESRPSRQWVNSSLSRKYNLQRIGRLKDLHCPQFEADWFGTRKPKKSGERLKVHTRVSTGTKVISFSDSDWLANQVEAGLLRKGGNFSNALIDINLEGAAMYFNDNFPTELIGIVVRDIQFCKPMGSILTTARVRHFQIDAMHPNARYPIIIQPLPLGVDRRMPEIPNSSSSMVIIPSDIKSRECYWKLHDEKPVPLFEMKCSYVPQNKMVWMPNLEVNLCPMKLQLDVDYILRVLSLIFDSASKYGKRDNNVNLSIMYVNEHLSYVTKGSMNFCLTYIENFCIHPVEVQLEINLKSDEEDDFSEGEGLSTSLTLHTISQSTNSGLLASVSGWLINVGANFAHVSPTYTYNEVCYTDTYSDIIDLAEDVFIFYLKRTIKQCYKVVFSMHLLGDPSLLAHQWKTGFTDLFQKTAGEIAAGGEDGVGKGVASLLQNVVGGTFLAIGRAGGTIADTITAITTSDLSSDNLKPKSASGRKPDHVGDGFVQGATYLAQTTAHGIAGLIGNPYRGVKTGTATGAVKGVATGIVGVVAFPIAGCLGFVAKTSTGIGQTTRVLDLGYIDARCRPRRVVPWGMPMSPNEIPYLKGIGIRIHTVRYQKLRKRALDVELDGENDDENDVSAKERRRIIAAEKRRLNPPSKQVSIRHLKDIRHRLTNAIRPKLLIDHPGNLVLSHYAVTFEETIELRSSDLQLGDMITVNFWNHKTLKTTRKAKALAVCNISVGDMYTHALRFYWEQLKRVESNLAREASSAHHNLDDQSFDLPLLLPAPQEFPLFRPLEKSKYDRKDIFEAISEEIVAIQKTEADRVAMFDSDSEAESDSSLLDGGKKTDDEGTGELIRRNERLFGSVSLSFFPIPW